MAKEPCPGCTSPSQWVAKSVGRASSLSQVSDPSPALRIQKLRSAAQATACTKASGDPLTLTQTETPPIHGLGPQVALVLLRRNRNDLEEETARGPGAGRLGRGLAHTAQRPHPRCTSGTCQPTHGRMPAAVTPETTTCADIKSQTLHRLKCPKTHVSYPTETPTLSSRDDSEPHREPRAPSFFP